jgi:tRNA pseudouridine55 synthase
MYQLARQGKAPELKARPVRIDELRLSRVDERRLGFSVVCSKGTYVRSLARDLGRAIGCGATLETLSRSVFGDFRLEDAVSLAELKGPAGHEALRRATRTPAEALGFMRTLEVDSDAARELLAGRQALLAGLAEAPRGQGELARVLCRDRLVAVVVGNGGRWCLDRVFSRS